MCRQTPARVRAHNTSQAEGTCIKPPLRPAPLLSARQARADFLIMLSGTERGDNARILRLSDMHLREYHQIGPNHDTMSEPGVIAVCWVQDEAKGNQVRLAWRDEITAPPGPSTHKVASRVSS